MLDFRQYFTIVKTTTQPNQIKPPTKVGFYMIIGMHRTPHNIDSVGIIDGL